MIPPLSGRSEMSNLLLLTRALTPSSEVLPALGLLSHSVKIMTPEVSALLDAPPVDAILIDGRRDLPAVRSFCRLLRTTGVSAVAPCHWSFKCSR